MNRNLTRLAVRIQTAAARKSDEGATAVEYGLLVALIAAVIIVAVGVLGGQVNDAFEFISGEMP